MFRHLRTKIIVSFCVLMIAGGTVTTAVVGATLSRTLTAALEREGIVFARMLAVQLGDPVAYRDRLAVRRLLVQARATHPDLEYAYVVSADGAVTDHSFPIDRFPVDLLAVARSARPVTLRAERGRVRDLPWPITDGVLGTVHVGVSTASVDAAVLLAVRNVLLTTGAALGVGIAGILFLASLITRPLLGLMDAARRFGGGDPSARAPVVGRDEIAALGLAFNQMAAEVRQRIAEREELSAYVERILDHLASTVFVVSEDLRVEYANRAARTEYGPSMGKRCGDVLQGDRPCDACPVAEALASSRTVERTHRSPTGRTFELTYVPMIGPGGHRAVVEKALDVTDRLELAARVHRAERLAVAGEIAAGVVHTVNNPLDGVRRALDLAGRNLDDRPRVERMLALASEGTERIMEVTRTLLGFARAEASTSPRPVAPRSIIEGAVDLVRLRAQARGVALEVDAPATLPDIWIDPQSMKEVLVNLLLNAVDACEGGGHVSVSAREAGAGVVEIITRDDGVGIERDALGRVFQPFFTTKEVGRGTGLGLSVARRIVEVHGGEIDVVSRPGEGAAFRVRLPVQPPSEGAST